MRNSECRVADCFAQPEVAPIDDHFFFPRGRSTSEVREQCRKSLQNSTLGVAEVARTMGQSQRTLQRRLAEHGTTFFELVNALRESLAREYVQDPKVGLATEAARALLETAAGKTIEAPVVPDNVRSQAVMRKLGFSISGQLQHAGRLHDLWVLRPAS